MVLLAYELHLTKPTCVGVRGVAPVEVGVDEFAEELVVRREEGIELRPSGAKRGVGRGGSARVGGVTVRGGRRGGVCTPVA